MHPQTVFYGTQAEAERLDAVLMHNCACEFDQANGRLEKRCGSHAMLLFDQRALNGMLWMLHDVERLKRQEGLEGT